MSLLNALASLTPLEWFGWSLANWHMKDIGHSPVKIRHREGANYQAALVTDCEGLRSFAIMVDGEMMKLRIGPPSPHFRI